MFLLDISSSISDNQFAVMQGFVRDIIDKLEENADADVRYALTLFATNVETVITLGDVPESISASEFLFKLDQLSKTPGLTCSAGALQALFRANFGPLDAEGKVDPGDTRLRAGVPAVIFFVTDGVSLYKSRITKQLSCEHTSSSSSPNSI
jgi:uncharacterized protein YegL